MSPEENWPEQDLEWLGKCPACGSAPRSELFGSLRDLAFQVAPGTWTMWRCLTCDAAYLDPRPSEDSIGRAYQNYYTHTQPCSAISERRARVKIRRQLGYYNAHYGYNFAGAWPFGRLIFKLDHAKASRADYAIRHLPAPSRKDAVLLDIGCGNGSFLLTARDLGYAAVGLEPDADAVSRGRAAGLDVRLGLLPHSGLAEGSFDHIFLNHVFEHLHKPREAAAEILRLLRPGGRVWLSQPNLDAIGLSLFGEFWRGLETPRHLCLYARKSLTRLLGEAGFIDIEMLPAEAVAESYFRQSLAMQQGLNPQETPAPPGWEPGGKKQARAANKAASRTAERGESLAMVAKRPG
jgi:SAM-dependent methyltransferase